MNREERLRRQKEFLISFAFGAVWLVILWVVLKAAGSVLFPFKHPVAETKYEALSWSFKHEMWHSAEMEAIKRELGYPIVWMEG